MKGLVRDVVALFIVFFTIEVVTNIVPEIIASNRRQKMWAAIVRGFARR